jgi:hypothetical protein
MPNKKIAVPPDIYRIKVTLLDTHPPIWRRLLVPASMTLGQLDGVLQVAMGWDGSHPHEFRIGQQRFGEQDPMEGFSGWQEVAAEDMAPLFNVLGGAGAKAVYTYDFGDSWKHRIAVEKVLPPEAGQEYPVCVAGKRHGPPDDCGGVWGYYEMLCAIGDPEHRQHGKALNWLGADYDPEAFSVDAVNREFAAMRRRRIEAEGE